VGVTPPAFHPQWRATALVIRCTKAMPIRAVAFDVYNTLVHRAGPRVQPIDVQRRLGEFGIHFGFEAYEAARRSVLFIDGAKRPITGWIDFLALLFARLGHHLSTDLLADLAALHHQRDPLFAHDDALPTIIAAKSMGLATCAFTSLPQFMAAPGIHTLRPHLDHYFDAAACGASKGDVRFYQAISARLALRTNEIACVGDEPLGDCELPAEQGWHPVLLDRDGRYTIEQASTPAAPGRASVPVTLQFPTIRSLHELPPILDRLRRDA